MARFQNGEWRIDEHALPFLADAQAHFFCTVEQMIAQASHGIFIGRVFDARFDEPVSPLLYEDGKLVASTRI